MSHTTIWQEPLQATRTDAWYAQLRRGVVDGGCCLVPTGVSPAQLARRLLTAEAPLLMGDVIHDIPQWIHQLADPRRPLAPESTRLLLMHQIAGRLPLSYFGPVRDQWTTARFLLRGVESVVRSGLDIAALPKIARAYGQEREADLATVLVPYLTAIHDAGLLDPSELVTHARHHITQTKRLPWQHLVVDLGHQYSPTLHALLQAFAERSDATLQIILPSSSGDTIYADTLRRWHTRLADLPGATSAPISDNEWTARTPTPTALYRAPSPMLEARAIANAIVARIRAGMPPERIGLILTSTQSLPLWHQVLQEAGLCQRQHLRHPPLIGTLSMAMQSERIWHRAPAHQSISGWHDWCAQQIETLEIAATAITAIHQGKARELHARRVTELTEWQERWRQGAADNNALATTDLSRDQFRQLLLAATPRTYALSHLANTTPIALLGYDQPYYVDLDVAYLPGATEGTLPRPARSTFFGRIPAPPEDPMVGTLRGIFPGPEQQLQTDTLVWDRWSVTCREWIVSFVETNESGRPTFPSHLATSTREDPRAPIPAVALTARPVQQTRWAGRSVHDRVATEQHARQRANDDGAQLLCDPDVQAHIAHRYQGHRYSATELETFQQCPFRFYTHYLLGLRPEEEASPELLATTRGELLHLALALLYREHLDALRAIATPDDASGSARLRMLIEQSLATASAQLQEKCAGQHHAIEKITRSQLVDLIETSVRRDLDTWRHLGSEALKPTYLEWTFGTDDAPVRIASTISDQSITLGGKIDRIDVHPQEKTLCIIDYKAGRGESLSGAMKKGLHLQLPLYLLAAQQRWPDMIALGGILFHLGSNERLHGLIQRDAGKRLFDISGHQRSSVTEAQWESILREAANTAVAAGQAIEQGAIPFREHACTHCAWIGLTRYEA